MNNISNELEKIFNCKVNHNESSRVYKLDTNLEDINTILDLFIDLKLKENINLFLEFNNVKIVVKYDYNKFIITANKQIEQNIDKHVYKEFAKLYNNPIFDVQIKTSARTTKLEI